MLIYRVECEDCEDGPYTCQCEVWQQERHFLQGKHSGEWFLRDRPGMLYDFPREKAGGVGDIRWYCGFSSMEQLEQWFDEDDRANLDNWGFAIVQYTSKDFLVGREGHQVFFIREDAE